MWVGTGVKCGGMELERGETSNRGSSTAAGGDSDMSAVAEDGGNSEMAYLRPGWGGLGYKGRDGGIGSGRGVSRGVDGVVSDMGRVWDVDGGETALLQGFWGKLWGWDRAWGFSGGFGGVFHHS